MHAHFQYLMTTLKIQTIYISTNDKNNVMVISAEITCRDSGKLMFSLKLRKKQKRYHLHNRMLSQCNVV